MPFDIAALRLRAEGYIADAFNMEYDQDYLAMRDATTDIFTLADEVERLQAENERFRNPQWVFKPAHLDDPTLVPIQGPWPEGVLHA